MGRVVPPEGWYAGDTHDHVQLCHRLPDKTPGEILARMDELGLAAVSALVWHPNGEGYPEHIDLVTGSEHEATLGREDRVLQFGIETSGMDCDDMGHLVALRLGPHQTDLLGPFRSCDANDGSGDFSTPILDALGRDARTVFGYAHQIWSTDRYHPEGYDWGRLRNTGLYAQDTRCTPQDVKLGFPPLSPLNTEAFPTLAAVEVALGKVDYLETVNMTADLRVFDAHKETRWWGMYYRLQGAGVRVGIGAGTDVNCVVAPRDTYTWVRTEGPLSYDAWVEGLVAGRASLSAGLGEFLDLELAGAPIGSEVWLESGEPLSVRVALHLADGESADAEAIELLVNGEVLRRFSLDPARRGGVQRFEEELALPQSSWIAARTSSNRSHTAASYAIVAGRPIGQCADAEYWTLWCDRVTKGILDFRMPETFVGCSGPAIVDTLAQGREVFEAYRDLAHGLPRGLERLGTSTPAQDGPIAILASEPARSETSFRVRCLHAPPWATGRLLFGRELLEQPERKKGAALYITGATARSFEATANEGGYALNELPPELWEDSGEGYLQYVWGDEDEGAWAASDVLRVTLP